MKFKLGENLGSRSAQLFEAANHDVATVLEEKLNGASGRSDLQHVYSGEPLSHLARSGFCGRLAFSTA
jgi:hypothetical protein